MKTLISCFFATILTILNSCDIPRGDANYEALDSVLTNLSKEDNDQPNQQSEGVEYGDTSLQNMEAIEQELRELAELEQRQLQEMEDNDPSGTYVYEKSGAMGGRQVVTIAGESWIGKLTLHSGFGESYDEEQAMYNTGIVIGNKLMDETGYVQVGRIWKNANKRWALDFAGSSGTIVMFKE
jgi:hypothetical protein